MRVSGRCAAKPRASSQARVRSCCRRNRYRSGRRWRRARAPAARAPRRHPRRSAGRSGKRCGRCGRAESRRCGRPRCATSSAGGSRPRRRASSAAAVGAERRGVIGAQRRPVRVGDRADDRCRRPAAYRRAGGTLPGRARRAIAPGLLKAERAIERRALPGVASSTGHAALLARVVDAALQQPRAAAHGAAARPRPAPC